MNALTLAQAAERGIVGHKYRGDTEKQRALAALHADYRHVMAYGGSRSGKTFRNVKTIVVRAMACRSRHLIGRRLFNSCKKYVALDTFPRVMELCFPRVKYKLDKTDWVARIPMMRDGEQFVSEIWFGGFDDKQRVDKILGAEFSTIYPNEATEIPWETIETIRSRLAEKSGLPLKMLYDCNPRGKKHWTYTVFVKGETEAGVKIPNWAQNYAAIQINPQDNLENLGDGYIDDLETLSSRARARFLEGVFQDDVEGALWNATMVDLAGQHDVIGEGYTVVAVDPAVTTNEGSDLTGIVVASKCEDPGYVVLGDHSMKATPNTWGQAVVNLYHQHQANAVVVEVNNGGDLVAQLLKSIDKSVKIIEVRASKGKYARAEPIAALYEQGKVAHRPSNGKRMHELEAEMTEYVPATAAKSPDRMDALVWALTHLSTGGKDGVRMAFSSR